MFIPPTLVDTPSKTRAHSFSVSSAYSPLSQMQPDLEEAPFAAVVEPFRTSKLSQKVHPVFFSPSAYLPVSQSLHESSPRALYLPGVQAMHAERCGALACLPASQGEQKAAVELGEA